MSRAQNGFGVLFARIDDASRNHRDTNAISLQCLVGARQIVLNALGFDVATGPHREVNGRNTQRTQSSRGLFQRRARQMFAEYTQLHKIPHSKYFDDCDKSTLIYRRLRTVWLPLVRAAATTRCTI